MWGWLRVAIICISCSRERNSPSLLPTLGMNLRATTWTCIPHTHIHPWEQTHLFRVFLAPSVHSTERSLTHQLHHTILLHKYIIAWILNINLGHRNYSNRTNNNLINLYKWTGYSVMYINHMTECGVFTSWFSREQQSSWLRDKSVLYGKNVWHKVCTHK